MTEFLDGTAYAEMIRAKKLSPEELLIETFKKAAQQNPALNAIISERKDKAISESRTIKDHGQPFYGLPLFIKNLGQNFAGLPITSGARLLKDMVAPQTDNFVDTLTNKGGFIIAGNTNTPEFGFKNITDPVLYGPTRNPWNTDYAPGGSSGGAAAVVASGISPIAGASDGGGSIRIPASFSGLIGLKPTRGRVPVGPAEWRSWQGASINFALTKSVRDTAAMLDILKIVQPAAVFQAPIPAKDYRESYLQPVKKLKIAFSTNSPVGTPVSDEAKLAVKNAVNFLTQQGHEVVEQDNPLDGIKMMESYYVMNAGETAAMMRDIRSGMNRDITIDDMELMSWTLYQTGKNISAVNYIDSLTTWDQASAAMATFHESYDLFLTPTTADHAPRIDAKLQTDEQIRHMQHVDELSPKEQQQLVYDMFIQSLTITPFTQQANLTGQPAISLPTHITENGLPLGIQFTAAKGNETLLLKIAHLFEEAKLFHFLAN